MIGYAIIMEYTLTDWLVWIPSALIIFGIMSTLYKMNPIYDLMEGIGMGATASYNVASALLSMNNQLIRPLTANFAANWWVMFAVIYGLLHFTLYVRSLIEVFRFVSIVTLSVNVGSAVRTNAAAIWNQVIASARIQDFSYFVLWICFFFATIYFIYGKKVDKALSYPRKIGRWVIIFELGALLTPMFLRCRSIYWMDN